MTNDKQIRNPKAEVRNKAERYHRSLPVFGFRHWGFFRHSSFLIRHFHLLSVKIAFQRL